MDSSGIVVLNVQIELFANEMTHWPIGQLAHPSFWPTGRFSDGLSKLRYHAEGYFSPSERQAACVSR